MAPYIQQEHQLSKRCQKSLDKTKRILSNKPDIGDDVINHVMALAKHDSLLRIFLEQFRDVAWYEGRNSMSPSATNNKFENNERKNLEFFADFLHEHKLSNVDVSNALGISRQAVSQWFKTDDCSLSRIYETSDKFGYQLKISINTPDSGKDSLTIDEFAKCGKIEGESFKVLRLTPLNFALMRSGITKTQLASDLGLSFQNVSRWFKASVDDISVAYIYKVAGMYDWNIKFDFIKQEPQTEI